MTLIDFKVIIIELVSKFDFHAPEDIETEAIKLVNPSVLLGLGKEGGGLKLRVKRLG